MTIALPETQMNWLKTHVSATMDENTQYTITIGAVTPEGLKDVQVNLDLLWFIAMYVDDELPIKLDIIKELLKNPVLVQRFKNTLNNVAVKRVLAEFLLFNYEYLNLFKDYVDFTTLNVPLDFVTYGLFIKRSEGMEPIAVSLDRLRVINLVLDKGFKVDPKALNPTQVAAVTKVILMEDTDSKFEAALRLVNAGFCLFSGNPINDAACAVRLIDARAIAAAKTLLEHHKDQFKNIKLKVAGDNREVGNLADFYYWVREDLDAVHYLKDNFGIELTPST